MIEGRFGDERLFREIHSLAYTQFAALTQSLQAELQQLVTQHIEFIMQDLDALMDENAATESENNPVLRETLGSELLRSRMTMDDVHECISRF